MVRINKFLASCNLGSRRKVEDLIVQGKVCLNNIITTDLSTLIDPEKDVVSVNNQVLTYKDEKLFILLNKPKGYIVTQKDEYNRKTIYDLLPDFARNLHPVGRLDADSEGLLLLTNDGNITNKITHPLYKYEKTYKVIVTGKIKADDILLLRNGVDIGGYTTKTAKVFLNSSSDEKSELKITIKEGKNRQIRKMIAAIGHEVISLKRLQIGEISIGKLPTGNWRFLNDKEILHLLKRRFNETRNNR